MSLRRMASTAALVRSSTPSLSRIVCILRFAETWLQWVYCAISLLVAPTDNSLRMIISSCSRSDSSLSISRANPPCQYRWGKAPSRSDTQLTCCSMAPANSCSEAAVNCRSVHHSSQWVTVLEASSIARDHKGAYENLPNCPKADCWAQHLPQAASRYASDQQGPPGQFASCPSLGIIWLAPKGRRGAGRPVGW